MRYVPRALLAGGLGLAAAFLVACGASSSLLSRSESSSLASQLSAASANLSKRNCVRAQTAIGTLKTQIANLPGSTDLTLVQDLSNGADTVSKLADKRCNAGSGLNTTSTATATSTVTHPQTSSTSTSTSTSTLTNTSPTTIQTTTATTPSTSTPATSTPTPGTTTGGSGGAPAGAGNTGAGNTGNG